MGNAIEVVAAVIAVIAGVVPALAWVDRRLIWTRRVTDGSDEDLSEAFVLYEHRIPDVSVRDSSEDIRRWLHEIREEESAGTAEWQDCLVLAKRSRQVVGFFYADLHLASGILFVSYLAVDEGDGSKKIPKRMARRVVRELHRRGRRFSGLVFELEAPKVAEPEEWLARYRLFKRAASGAHVVVKRVCMNYDQPRLSLWDSAFAEKPLLLFYARAPGHDLGNTISKAELVAVLDALLNHWYASAYEDEPDRNAEYRAYLRTHYERTIAQLPEEIPLSEQVRPNLGLQPTADLPSIK